MSSMERSHSTVPCSTCQRRAEERNRALTLEKSSGCPVAGVFVGSLQVGWQAFDLSACQGWEMSPERDVWSVAAGESEAADPVEGSPHRAVFSALRSEAEFLRPLDEVELEAIGFGIEVGGDPTKEQDRARATNIVERQIGGRLSRSNGGVFTGDYWLNDGPEKRWRKGLKATPGNCVSIHDVCVLHRRDSP